MKTNLKEIAFFIGFFLIVLGAYAFLRPDLLGADSYYFYNHACGLSSQAFTSNPLAQAVFNAMPCDYFAFKILAVALLTLSLFFLQQVIKLFNPSNEWGWAYALLNPFFVIVFLELENDQLAMPFLMLALYFYAKSKVLKENYFLSYNKAFVGILLVLGLGFWNGSLLLALPFAIGSIFALAVSLTGLAYAQANLGLLFNFMVTENILFIGVLANALLLIGWKKIPKELKWETLLVGLMALVNSKFALLLTPFLVLGFVQYLQNFKIKTPNFQAFTKAMPYACLIGVLLALPNLYPSLELRQSIESAKAYSELENLPVKNEWGFGYILENEGVKTDSLGGGEAVQDYNNSIALVSADNPQLVNSCKQLSKGKYNLFKCGGNKT